MDETNEQLTLRDFLTRRLIELDDIVRNADILSEKHKNAMHEYETLEKMLIDLNKLEWDQDLRNAEQELKEEIQNNNFVIENRKLDIEEKRVDIENRKLDIEEKKVDMEANKKQDIVPGSLMELGKLILEFGKDILICALPLAAAAERQRHAQKFMDIQMRREWEFEQCGLIRSQPGKTSWRMIEQSSRDI